MLLVQANLDAAAKDAKAKKEDLDLRESLKANTQNALSKVCAPLGAVQYSLPLL